MGVGWGSMGVGGVLQHGVGRVGQHGVAWVVVGRGSMRGAGNVQPCLM